jgi:hypothetical protein
LASRAAASLSVMYFFGHNLPSSLNILAEIVMRGDAFADRRQHHRLILQFLAAM